MLKRIYFILIVSICFLIVTTSCFHYVARYDSTYRGKVINAETGEPIEGVVVLGVWYTEIGTVAGPKHHYYDARETVTDMNGEFEIQGQGLRLFSNLEPVNITVFKAGYNYNGLIWKPEKEGDYIYHPDIKWNGNRPTIPLKKLTMEERRGQDQPDFYIGERYDEKENITHTCLPKNIKLLPKEVNKELLEQRRKPYDLEEGRCEK